VRGEGEHVRPRFPSAEPLEASPLVSIVFQ